MANGALAVLATLLLARSTVGVVEGSCKSSGKEGLSERCAAPSTAIDSDTVNLLQTRLSSAKGGSRRSEQAITTDQESGKIAQCSNLGNKGAYFTVDVGIGTPEQTFNLVADTGSDALIIPDCRCVQSGFCEALTSCFSSGNSTSFGLDIKPTDNANSLAVMGAKMNYGSGQIQVLVASEDVRVASSKGHMHNGVFLMEDRRSLKVHGDFEGILGLGLPHKNPTTKTGVKIPVFMNASGQTKYSLCFNEWPKQGALRVGMDLLSSPMTNIGTVHWGLDLQGFSVGGSTEPVIFCDPKKLGDKQKTACGAIPDSGTTLMMGPAKHIRQLYSALCDKWPRCKSAAEKNGEKKSKAFHELLYACESWMTDENGVNEIPSIFLHMAGAEGVPQSVELSAWSFVVETTKEIYKVVTEKVFGILPISGAVDTGKKQKICTASFGPQEYNTVKNGPVWIMGAPLFYATSVGYDLGGNGKKPQIAFQKGPCTLCNETAALISSGSETHTGSTNHAKQRPPRWLDGPLREPSTDLSRLFEYGSEQAM